MDADITTTGTRIVYENRWMRVREDAIHRRDGSTGIYGVIEKPDFVVIAAVEAGLIHLVEQYRYPVRGRYWELPQGTWNARPGADPEAEARAELAEETGLQASSMLNAGYLFQAYGYATQGCHVFLASGLTPGAASLEQEEQDLVARAFPLAEAEAMIRDGRIQDSTTVAAFGLLRLRALL